MRNRPLAVVLALPLAIAVPAIADKPVDLTMPVDLAMPVDLTMEAMHEITGGYRVAPPPRPVLADVRSTDLSSGQLFKPWFVDFEAALAAFMAARKEAFGF